MSNATQTAPVPRASEQGSHQWLITMQIPFNGGFSISSWAGTFTPPEGATRHDAYTWVRQDIARAAPEYAGGSVLFFDVQPNRL